MEPQKIYSVSMELSQRIWEIVDEWPVFARDTLGKQMVRSSDSISANLKEGMGRYFYKDRNQFNIYSRGSLFETHCWLEKALTRNLISKEDFDRLMQDFDWLYLEINKMIKNTRTAGSPISDRREHS